MYHVGNDKSGNIPKKKILGKLMAILLCHQERRVVSYHPEKRNRKRWFKL
jgi:hypothetical protein